MLRTEALAKATVLISSEAAVMLGEHSLPVGILSWPWECPEGEPKRS